METKKYRQFKVLAVDDNPKNIQVLGNILREAGFLVGFALDGQNALTLLKETYDYDLVLLDINMPVMNGLDMCRIMRADEKLKELPVIFLTAYSESDVIIKGFDAGAQDYVTKPFNSKELLSRVNTQLQLKHKTDQLTNWNVELEQKVAERTKMLAKANKKLVRQNKIKNNFLSLNYS